jgi:hypothetical protein
VNTLLVLRTERSAHSGQKGIKMLKVDLVCFISAFRSL